MPASMYGMVLGLAGLGGDWRLAHELWGLPAMIGEAINVVAICVWAIISVFFAAKWIFAREEAMEEAEHPVHCCFIGLAGVATMLVARAFLSYSHSMAVALLALGMGFSIVFATWRTGIMWRGGRAHEDTTAILYLPTVAGSLVSALVLGSFGYVALAQLLFGAGMFTWAATESVLLQRLFTAPEMALPLRPTLGILLAPPAVACAAYLSLTARPPDLFANGLLGYSLLQLAMLIRVTPWIMKQPFAPSYWAATLGMTALASASMRMASRGGESIGGQLAPYLFFFANLLVSAIAVGTIALLAQGRLLPTSHVGAAE
ncbi:dicarboxylate transporter/tellurite-resistance protein TehA [Mesorhizobium sp. M2E.F.Ca.ET.209.01.1.1]|nr:dicarboxylate transporter/tellurite-resistance protein TehA [Mesorhizobium sp. M2E.F.Ca.ET.209.01.1.1]